MRGECPVGSRNRKEEDMVALSELANEAVAGVPGKEYLPASGRTRLAAELFNGRFRPSQHISNTHSMEGNRSSYPVSYFHARQVSKNQCTEHVS
jgi:hypothetical protein